MYIPNHFKMNELADNHQFIDQFSFGILVSPLLTGTHLPFILQKNEGELGALYAHFARANTDCKTLDGSKVFVIFNGPHSYISPNWYAKGPAVPTWNYAAVHAYGTLTFLSKEDTLTTVNNTVKKYEPALINPQDKADSIMTAEYTERLLSGIIGFKIQLTKIEGKQKLGQQKSKADQKGVYQALSESTKIESIALAQYMEKIQLGMGS